jgi:hypothetical protein
MDSRTAPDERAAFTERLCGALRSARCSLSPTEFAQEYNLRTDGPRITTHAARKWLRAEAIPTQNKLLVLANWLALSPQWLRYGEDPTTSIDCAANDAKGLPRDDRILLQDIKRLDERSRQVVNDVVASLLRNTLRSGNNVSDS